MENYVRAENVEEFVPEVTIEGAKDGVLVMKVKPGSKIKNLMQFAEKRMASDSIGQIVWEGRGDAVQKTITCAEIMKKKSSHSLHQITCLSSMRIVETWKPRHEGLDDIRVNRQLPLIKILLSKDLLNVDANGYQAPDDTQGLFSRSQGGNRPRLNKSQRNQQKKSQVKQEDGDKDETLLADTIRRKEFEKMAKLEKRKKREAGKQGDSKKHATSAEATASKEKGDKPVDAARTVSPAPAQTESVTKDEEKDMTVDSPKPKTKLEGAERETEGIKNATESRVDFPKDQGSGDVIGHVNENNCDVKDEPMDVAN